MSLGFVAIPLAIGCLVGAWIPLPAGSGKPDATRMPASTNVRPSPFDSGPVTISLDNPSPADAISAATTNPQEFFHWLLKADPQPSREIVEAFFTAWIERNPDAAFQAALMLPERFGYNMESQYFPREVQLLFRRDPLAALRWVGRIEGVIGHDITLHSTEDLITKLQPLDPEEVRTWLNRSPLGGVSAGMAQTFATMLARKDPMEAIRWVESLNINYQNVAMPMMLYHLSEKDLVAARDYIRNAPSHIKQYCTLYAAPSDSAGDILAQMKILEDEMGTTAYTGIGNQLTRLYSVSPKAAVEHVVAMEGTSQGMDAVRGLAEAACLNGPSSKAMEMIATLPDSMQYEAARAAMFKRMPFEVTGFLEPLANGTMKGGNLDAYIGLLADFVDGEQGAWSVTAVPEHLEKFQTWIRENPGPERDRFIRRAMESMENKPEERDKIFGTIPPEEMKRILEGQVAR